MASVALLHAFSRTKSTTDVCARPRLKQQNLLVDNKNGVNIGGFGNMKWEEVGIIETIGLPGLPLLRHFCSSRGSDRNH
jgi:hypothetical protein